MKRGLGIKVLLGCFLCLAVTVGGCYINIGSCGWPQVKYERVVQLSAPFSAGGSFEAVTHNGSITITGGDVADCNVTATIVGRAMSTEDAQKIAEQTNVKLVSFGDKLTARIEKPTFVTNQSVSVRFDVRLPGKADLQLTTHNGKVKITNISGDIEGITHNGKVFAEKVNGSIELRTHNGRIVCDEISGDIKLKTHNGRIEIVYAKDAPGICNIEAITYNGRIKFTAPPNLSAEVELKTHHGSIKTELPITVMGKISRRKLAGKIGAGEGTLDLETHNGSIKIKKQK